MRDGITVVIPAHDRAHLLSATLDCVLSQSLHPDEVLVVDDGSTDGTGAVAERYAGQGVRVIRIESSGHLVARNVGLRAARSGLVAFCDSDDLWRPTYLATVQRLWLKAPDLTASYANFSIVRDGVWSRATKFDQAPAGFWEGVRRVGAGLGRVEVGFAERLIDFQPFFPTGMVVNRRAFLAIGGWDEGVAWIVGADFATALRVAGRPPLGLIQEPLVGIRKHGANLSGDTEAMNLGNARVLEHVLATRPEMAGLARKIRASVAGRRRDALAAAFVRHDMAEVRRIYRLIPREARSPAVRMKASVATLPGPVSMRVNEMALWLGTSKASLMTMAGRSLARPGLPRADRGLSGAGYSSVLAP